MAWLFFGLSGRIARLPFFLGTMFLAVIEAFVLYKTVMTEGTPAADVWSGLFVVAWAATLWPMMALSGKRLHDFGQSALVAIATLVPAVSIIVFFALCFWPGDAGPNRYGARTNEPATGT